MEFLQSKTAEHIWKGRTRWQSSKFIEHKNTQTSIEAVQSPFICLRTVTTLGQVIR